MTSLQSSIEHVVWSRLRGQPAVTPQEVLHDVRKHARIRDVSFDLIVAGIRQMESEGFIRFVAGKGYVSITTTEEEGAPQDDIATPRN